MMHIFLNIAMESPFLHDASIAIVYGTTKLQSIRPNHFNSTTSTHKTPSRSTEITCDLPADSFPTTSVIFSFSLVSLPASALRSVVLAFERNPFNEVLRVGIMLALCVRHAGILGRFIGGFVDDVMHRGGW